MSAPYKAREAQAKKAQDSQEKSGHKAPNRFEVSSSFALKSHPRPNTSAAAPLHRFRIQSFLCHPGRRFMAASSTMPSVTIFRSVKEPKSCSTPVRPAGSGPGTPSNHSLARRRNLRPSSRWKDWSARLCRCSLESQRTARGLPVHPARCLHWRSTAPLQWLIPHPQKPGCNSRRSKRSSLMTVSKRRTRKRGPLAGHLREKFGECSTAGLLKRFNSAFETRTLRVPLTAKPFCKRRHCCATVSAVSPVISKPQLSKK